MAPAMKQPEPSPRSYHVGAARFEADALTPGLHIVATPIGNLGDITLRALAALAAADVVLCEDTRTSAKLIERYGIRARLEPYHEHNAAKARPHIIERLKAGAAMVLISDAGTPLVSDPGYRLVAEAVAEGIAVTTCPGASAVLAGLALSGLPTDRFMFLGFLPVKEGERRRLFEEVSEIKSTLVFFESPHRVIDSLREMAQGLPGRLIAVTRETTKLHEEVLRGTAAGIAAALAERPSVKGEITIVAGPPAAAVHAATDADVQAAIAQALAALPASKAATEVARRFGLPKKDVYDRILALKGESHG
jgi:16S rRNA (cytidine1402-2'-O)-methyltransferase